MAWRHTRLGRECWTGHNDEKQGDLLQIGSNKHVEGEPWTHYVNIRGFCGDLTWIRWLVGLWIHISFACLSTLTLMVLNLLWLSYYYKMKSYFINIFMYSPHSAKKNPIINPKPFTSYFISQLFSLITSIHRVNYVNCTWHIHNKIMIHRYVIGISDTVASCSINALQELLKLELPTCPEFGIVVFFRFFLLVCLALVLHFCFYVLLSFKAEYRMQKDLHPKQLPN